MSSKDKSKDRGIKSYKFEGKTYYEVIVQKRNKSGSSIKKRSRFTKNGNRISSLKSADEVKFWLKSKISTLVNQSSNHSWESWINIAYKEMRMSGLKESTIEVYHCLLLKWLDPAWVQRPLSSFTKKDVYEFIHDYLIRKEATDWTRKNVLKRVHRIFEMALDAGEISKNPARGIKLNPKKPDGLALTPKEVETLLEKGKAFNHDYYPHWVVALMTGLRNGELYALRWSHIDLESNLIHLVEQFTSKDGLHPPKNGRSRVIDLSDELKSFLLETKEKARYSFKETLWKWDKDSGLNKAKHEFEYDDFILPRVTSWRYGSQAKELRSFCKLIGIREVKFHDLRATHITNLLTNGVSISKVMKQVGHSKMSTTDAYHRLTGVQVKGISNKLGYSLPKETEAHENVIQLFPKKA